MNIETKFDIGQEVIAPNDTQGEVKSIRLHHDGITYFVAEKECFGLWFIESDLRAAPKELFVAIGSDPDGLMKCLSLPRVSVEQLHRELTCFSIADFKDIKIMKLTEIGEE